ncbi:MAG: LysM peptidoglycan-binding domain-containing protein, partial [Candidatus Omnitrophica bacterium]|nr:LysM peptidoglycan-binding domain-containing protein [Candidatus Omnitrophota bacterium]
MVKILAWIFFLVCLFIPPSLFSETSKDSILYTVQPGDSLYKIAKKYKTTVELLQKSNHLEGDLIQSGMILKISTAVYSITIDKSENKLMLYSNG